MTRPFRPSDLFKNIVREAAVASAAYDAHRGLSMAAILGSEAANDYLAELPENFDADTPWDIAVKNLFAGILSESGGDKTHAVRLAQIVARYAVRTSTQQSGPVTGYRLNDNRGIVSSLYSAAYSAIRDIKDCCVDEHNFALSEDGLAFVGKGFSPGATADSDWRQVHDALFYFARRAAKERKSYDIASSHWREAIDRAPVPVARASVELARRKLRRGPDRHTYLNKVVVQQMQKFPQHRF